MLLVTDKEGHKKIENEYVLKEGSNNTLKITFRVHNDIVLGMKIVTHAKAGPLRQSTNEDNMGNYSPTVKDHVWESEVSHVPEGFFARASFNGKTIIADVDGTVHLNYEFKFRVDKKW